MVKIIFLDIDGTLYAAGHKRISLPTEQEQDKNFPNDSYPKYIDRAGKKFDAPSMSVLRALCADPEVRIVISSFWRTTHTFEELKAILQAWGINPEIVIGITPVFNNETLRGSEIQEWLMDNSALPVFSIVALDDQVYDFSETWPDNWVHCKNLLRNVEEQAKKILNTQIDFKKSAHYLKYIEPDLSYTDLSVRFDIEATRFFEIAMGLGISRSTLLERSIWKVVNEPKIQSASFYIGGIDELSKIVRVLQDRKSPVTLTFYGVFNKKVEVILNELHRTNHPLILFVNSIGMQSIPTLVNWLLQKRYQSSLTLNFSATNNTVLFNTLLDVLKRPQHSNVQVISDTTIKRLARKANVYGQSERSDLAERTMLDLLEVFQSHLKDNANTESFTSIAAFEMYFWNLTKIFFQDDHIGSLLRAQLCAIPGVTEVYEIDDTNQRIKKICWSYASYFLKISFQFNSEDLEALFNLTMKKICIQSLENIRPDLQEVFAELDLTNTTDHREKINKLVAQTAMNNLNFFSEQYKMQIDEDYEIRRNCDGSSTTLEVFSCGV